MFLPLNILSKRPNIASSYPGQNLTGRVKSWTEGIMTNDKPQCPTRRLGGGDCQYTGSHNWHLLEHMCCRWFARRGRWGLTTQLSTAARRTLHLGSLSVNNVYFLASRSCGTWLASSKRQGPTTPNLFPDATFPQGSPISVLIGSLSGS